MIFMINFLDILYWETLLGNINNYVLIGIKTKCYDVNFTYLINPNLFKFYKLNGLPLF